jgi:hypothetical protein
MGFVTISMSSQNIIRRYLQKEIKKSGFTAKDLFLKGADGALTRYDIINGILFLEEQK